MKTRLLIASAFTALSLVTVTVTGCSVARDQETTGNYVDDSVVTTRVKTKFAQDSMVSAMAISVETMKGVVQLSGFAKSSAEKQRAEELAQAVQGVKTVRNDIVVRS